MKSPSEEWVKYLVNIAEFYYTNEDKEKAKDKLNEAYDFIGKKVVNLDSEVFCFARSLRTAVHIFEDDSEFINLLKDEFHEAFNQLLSNSAAQFEILAKTIKELALFDFQFAYSTAIKLNTSNNRSDAYSLILKTLITSKGNTENISDYIEMIFNNFSEIEISHQLNSISEFIVDNEFVLHKANYQTLLSFVDEISDPYLRSKILINFAEVIYEVDKELSLSLADEAITSWEKENELKLRLKLGFQIVIGLSNIDIDRASELCEKVQRNYLEPGTTLVSGEFDHIYKNIIILVIRSFTKENVRKSDITDEIIDLISRFPSKFTQIELFSHVAASLYRIEEIGLANDIVRNHVIKNIEELESRLDKSQILPLCFPVIYLYDNKNAEDFLEDLSKREKDLCWLRVIKWSLTRNLLSDPTDFNYHRNSSDLHSLRDISIEALNKIRFDSYIYQCTIAITGCVLSSLNKNIDLEQSLDILRNLEGLIRKKLPDKDNIQHPGYKIIALSRILRAKSQIQKNFPRGRRIPKKEIRQGWQEVFNSIDEVENIADKVYIYCLCAEDYYYWAETNAFEKLSEAEKLIVEIPSILDRQNRFTVLAETYDKLGESQKANQILNDAVDLILKLDLSDTDDYLDLIIQAAYGINTELANELVSRLDKRIPPHSKFSANLEKHVRELIEAPNEIMTYERYEKTLEIALRKSSKKLLRDLLIGRSKIYGHDILSRWLITSSYFGFKTYFAVANWVFESNRLERVLNRIETKNYVNLVGLVLDMGKFISPGKRNGILDQFLDIKPNQEKTLFVFRNGEREKAKEFVFHWIQENCIEQLTICDPYFSYKELEFISYSPSTCERIIITTDTYLDGGEEDIARRIKMNWKKYSSEALKNVLIIIVPEKSSDQFHDRALISETIGLNLGQSLNGLGKKTGTIKFLTEDETEEMKGEYLNPLLNNRTWFNRGIKPIIISFR